MLLVKLKYTIDRINGLNWVLVNKVKKIEIHFVVIRCYYKIHSYIKKETS
jgi:hypothetical protein